MNQKITISDLPELTGTVEDEYMLPIDDGEITKKVSVGHFEEAASATARQYAEAAADSATAAAASEHDAEQAAIDVANNTAAAVQAANDARGAATRASGSADAAAAADVEAQRASSAATSSANSASQSATEASGYKNDAQAAANRAASWADYPGQTGSGDATHNAHFYADQAAAAIVGVASWNGRSGNVVPEDDDYDIDMMGDVAILNPLNDQILQYDNETQKWKNKPIYLPGKMDIDGSNAAEHVQFDGAFTVGSRGYGEIGANSVAEGHGTAAEGDYSHAEGYKTRAVVNTFLDWQSGQNIPVNFYDGAAVVYDGEIHILGGSVNKKSHYSYNGSSWSAETALPYNFYNGSAVVYNNKIHILGSGDSSNVWKSHYSFDGSEWVEETALPYNFYRGSAVVYNNKIHILGGQYETISPPSTHRHYSYDGTSWVEESTLPMPFYDGSAVVYDNMIHILGSSSANPYYYRHYVYDGSMWTQAQDVPYAFARGCSVVFGDSIHVFGGGAAATSPTYTEHYSYDGSGWNKEFSLEERFYRGAAVVYNEKIYKLGGYVENKKNEFSPVIINGYGSHAEGENTIAVYSATHAEGTGTSAIANYAHAEGSQTTASGEGSHAEGSQTQATKRYSHAEGNNTRATGDFSHAEGDTTNASASYSHAEGRNTVASAISAHAEGRQSTASGAYSHAEGYTTTASGENSHAEGSQTIANKTSSHAEGFYTKTGAVNQHVQGKYNIGRDDTLFEIGNGTADNARHNVFEVYEDGVVGVNSAEPDTYTFHITSTAAGSAVQWCNKIAKFSAPNNAEVGKAFEFSVTIKVGDKIESLQFDTGTNFDITSISLWDVTTVKLNALAAANYTYTKSVDSDKNIVLNFTIAASYVSTTAIADALNAVKNSISPGFACVYAIGALTMTGTVKGTGVVEAIPGLYYGTSVVNNILPISSHSTHHFDFFLPTGGNRWRVELEVEPGSAYLVQVYMENSTTGAYYENRMAMIQVPTVTPLSGSMTSPVPVASSTLLYSVGGSWTGFGTHVAGVVDSTTRKVTTKPRIVFLNYHANNAPTAGLGMHVRVFRIY